MLIYLLLILLIFQVLFCFVVFKKDLLSPAFVFSLSFSISVICAIIYKSRWDLDLHLNTFMVLLFGVVEYVIFTTAIHLLYLWRYGLKAQYNNDLKPLVVERWKLLSFILLEIFVILWTIKSLLQNFNGFHTLSEIIFQYQYLTKFTEESVDISSNLYLMRDFVHASGFVWIYILINNILVKYKKGFILIAINVLLCLISDVILGGRGGAIQILFGGIVIFYLLWKRRFGWESNIKFKHILGAIVFVGILMLSFQYLGNLLGRNSTVTLADYIAKYLGAQIKNLDLFLQETRDNSSNLWGSQTFIYVIRFLGESVGIIDSYYFYQLDLPFRYVNGFSLGNVYTTFYPYIYDFGYSGVFYLVLVMAIITQIIYERAKRAKKTIDIKVLLYSFLFYSIVFSFFSNKFYERVFNISFIKLLIFWYIIRFVLLKIKIRREKE